MVLGIVAVPSNIPKISGLEKNTPSLPWHQKINIARTLWVNFGYEQPKYFSKGITSASLSVTKLLLQNKTYYI